MADARRAAAAAADLEQVDGPGVPPTPRPSLGRSAASGMVWQGASYLFGKVVVLVTTLVLARLLVPEEFGLVALAMIFVTYADSVADLGVAQALVYLPRTKAYVRAALVAALGFGLILAGGAAVAAPLVAAFFGEPEVAPLLQLLSLSLLAGAMASVPEALLRRDLQFRLLSGAAVIRSVVVGVVSVTLALQGWDALALAWGTVAGALVHVVATWSLLPNRPDVRIWRTERAALRAVLGYGLPAAGGMLLAKLIFDIDYLIVGSELGAEALGLYTMAFRLPELLIINVFFVVSSVTFPLYSRAREDPERLRRGYLTSVRIQAVYGMCAGLTVAAVAPVLVPVLLGSTWEPAVVALVPLAVYAALRSLGAGANDVYKALGRPGLSVKISLLRLAVLVPALLVATRWGLAGVAWTQVIAAAAFVVLMQGVALRVLGLRWGQLARAVGPALTAGAASGAAALAVTLALPGPAPVVLAVAGLAAALAAAAALRLTAPTLIPDVLRMARRKAARSGD